VLSEPGQLLAIARPEDQNTPQVLLRLLEGRLKTIHGSVQPNMTYKEQNLSLTIFPLRIKDMIEI